MEDLKDADLSELPHNCRLIITWAVNRHFDDYYYRASLQAKTTSPLVKGQLHRVFIIFWSWFL